MFGRRLGLDEGLVLFFAPTMTRPNRRSRSRARDEQAGTSPRRPCCLSPYAR
jgi:hypothetical protein